MTEQNVLKLAEYLAIAFLLPFLFACSGSTCGQPTAPSSEIEQSGENTESTENSTNENIREFEIAHNKRACVGVGTFHCILAREPGQTDWNPILNIDGFTAEWGHSYRVRVRVEEVANPPADGSSIRYILVETVEDRVVDPGTTFSYLVTPVSGGTPLVNLEEDRGNLLNEKDFVCQSPEICQQIRDRLAADDLFSIQFRHPDDPAQPLTATGIER